MGKQIKVVSPEPARLRKVLTQLSDETFSWAYLGQAVTESLRAAQIFQGRGTQLDTADRFHQAAEDLRNGYLTYLYEMGREINHLRWWLTSLSYRSGYASNTFQQVSYLKVVFDLISGWEGPGTLVLVIAHEPCRRALESNISQIPDVNSLEIGGARFRPSNFTFDILRVLAHRGVFVAREVTRLLWARLIIRHRYIPPEPATLVVSSVSFRNRALKSEFHRSFFGDLTEQLGNLGFHLATVPLVLRGVNYRDVLRGLRESEVPTMVPHRYLTLKDVLSVAVSTLKRPPLPSPIPRFENLDISPLLEDEHRNSWIGNLMPDAMLLTALTQRWAGLGATIARMIYVYENQPWERALCWGARRFLPETYMVGYQHARAPKLLLSFYLAPGGESEAPLPHRVVTVGAHTARLLSSSGFRPGQVRVGGALQMQNPATPSKVSEDGSHKGGRPTVLIACSNGLEESAELAHMAAHLFSEDEKIRLIIKFHPIMPFERITGVMHSQLPGHVEISEEPLGELMSESSLMVYSGSTVCVDALTKGLPVIHVRPQFDLDMDPLEETPDVRLEAMGLDDLREKVRWLLHHREEYVAQHQKRWDKLVNDIYGPVTPQTYLAFVDP